MYKEIQKGSGAKSYMTNGLLIRYMEKYLRMVRSTRRVYRVLGFFSSRPNWDSPTHSPPAWRVCPPLRVRAPHPFGSGGGGHTGWRESGGVPIPTREQTLWYSRYKCSLWQEELYEECPLSSLNESALEIHSLTIECEPPLFQHQ